MIIVVTGMVGIDKKSYLRNLCTLAEERGHTTLLCNVGDMMYAEAPDIPKGRILDIPLRRLHQLRRSVFKDIIAKSQTAENVIVNTHATFRWRHGLFPAVDFDQMRQLNADIYICMIDGVTAMHQRLTHEHAIEHTLKDLIVWREEEMIATEMLCKGIDERTRFYCLARGAEQDTAEMCYRLVFEPQRPKAYLSYPMTHVAGMPEVLSQIQNFRQCMHEGFTCFDPGDLEESYLPWLAKEAKAKGHAQLELEVTGNPVKLDIEQIHQIEKDINSQIYSRDFLLIEQADMIISFIPTLPDGRAAISSGVERELQHAHESARQVYVIWQADYPPSVFVTQTATKVFDSMESAMRFFEQKGPLKT